MSFTIFFICNHFHIFNCYFLSQLTSNIEGPQLELLHSRFTTIHNGWFRQHPKLNKKRFIFHDYKASGLEINRIQRRSASRYNTNHCYVTNAVDSGSSSNPKINQSPNSDIWYRIRSYMSVFHPSVSNKFWYVQ